MKSILPVLGLTGAFFFAAFRASGAPANDNFANAIPLTGPVVTATGNNQGATKPFGPNGDPSVGGNFGGANVWWTWTASASGPTTIDTMGSDFNTLLGVYTGNAPNQLALIGDNNDFSGNTWSRVAFNAVAGTVYRIQVDGLRTGGGFGSPAMGNIVLHIMGVGGVSLDSPTNGMIFTLGDTIPVSVGFTPEYPSPPATRVDFYLGTTLFASSTTAPFSAVASNAPAGTNTLYVVAVNSAGTPIQSPPVSVFVQRIGVTLLTPAEDTFFANNNPITVTAHGYLPSGSITNIAFYVDGVKFGEDTAPPYSATWSNVVGGSHRFTAIGKSDAGASYNSQPVNIGVASLLVHSNSVWRYKDDGSDQGTGWVAPGFDDSSWSSGPAELGYGDADERTVVNSGPTNNFFATTYFRSAFQASNVASFANLLVLLAYDDAGIVYLNGQEIYRTAGLPTNVAYNSYTTGTAIEESMDVAVVSVSNLVEGANVLAVEIHQQAPNSSDISFFLQLSGLPRIIHNLSPTVSLTAPTNNFFALAPPAIDLASTASDADGSVVRVEYYADGVKVAESTSAYYTTQWPNPPVGPHSLTAVAVDDLGARTESDPVSLIVYDDVGTPFARITAPRDGAAVEGGTNQIITAYANAEHGVTNVEFLSNGVLVGQDVALPYGVVWNAPFGTNLLSAVAVDANGVRGTSAVVRFIAYPNSTAPRLVANSPAGGLTLTNLTTITVEFSEPVQHIEAGDLLINGFAATGLAGAGSNYVFTFPQPPYGAVAVSWAVGHGITDIGFPADLPFDDSSPEAQWSYTLIDRTPPTIIARTPAAGTSVSNVTQISVTFSEPVANVDAGDLLVNGAPALSMTGGGVNYLFNVTQPAAGTVNITWSTTNGIVDLADTPNAFNRTAGAWSFTLDTRIVLVQSNANWRFVKGLAEASTPRDAWRQPDFDDSSWSNSQAPFFFGDPYTNFPAGIYGTQLGDMLSNYTTIYLRREFNVENRGVIPNVLINHQSDDGFIAWLNGYEVWRYNVPGGDLPYTTNASSAANEPNQAGAAYIVATLTNNAVSRLVNGRNVLSIQALNQNIATSSDFGFNAQLYFFPVDLATIPPRLLAAEPAAGDLFYLTNVTIHFSEGVSGVDASDLLVSGVPATAVSSTTNASYTFQFPQPAYGPVLLTWATNHGIVDYDNPPRAFDRTAAGSTIAYTLLNPSSPRVASQSPAAGNTLTGLTAIAVTFTEPVAGVEASDLLVSGSPAGAVSSADDTTWNFSFNQPAFGTVTIRWATNHGITDREVPAAPFDPTRFGGQWNYTLVDPVPSVTITSPTNNTYVLPPGLLSLRANATDNDGTIARVEYYSNGAKLGEATNAPYLLTVPDVQLGTYRLQAVATDNTGLLGTSAPVSYNVVTSLPITLVRGPYLQMGCPTGAVVRFRTDLFSDAVLYYGTDPTSLSNVATQVMLTNEHIVAITGLQPDTQYYYSIGSSGQRVAGTNGPGSDFWFRTSPEPGTRKRTRIWVIGDAGTAANGAPDRQQSTRDAYTTYAATNGAADVFLMLGDNAYNSGQDSEYQEAVFDMYPTILRNKFVWPTIGNHESNQSTTANDFPYLNMFTLPRNGESGGVPSGTQKYYSFDYANVHFLCLDSETSGYTTNAAMYQWMQDDLAATTAEWVIAYFHHPPYTHGTHNSDNESDLIQIRQNWVPVLEAYGVDLVLNGHSHVHERSYLLDGHYGVASTFDDSMKVDAGDGREEGSGAYRKNHEGRGIIYNVAGSSGQALGGTLDHPAHFVSINELGTLIIDVEGNRLDAKFLTATAGVFSDHYTLLKSDHYPPAPLQLTALATNASRILLAWTPGSSRQTGYIIERSQDGVNFLPQMGAAEDATNALDSSLLANATYFYRVRATNASGISDYSNIASATTVAPSGVPRAPTALAATASSGSQNYRSQMLVRWQDRSTNEGSFQIERSMDGIIFVPVSTVAANINFFLDRNLESATDYYYRVRAYNGAGFSEPSNVASDSTHPQSQVVFQGTPATFHAGIEGAPGMSYQWRFAGNPIPGQTNEALVMNSVQTTDEGAYSVVLTDSSGHEVSNPAYLFVVGPPRLVTQPQDTNLLVNGTINLSVAATGTAPFTYRWRKDGLFIPAETSSSLTISNAQRLDQAFYDVIVENQFGAVISRQARVIVLSQPSAAPLPDIVTGVLIPVSVTTPVIDPNNPPLELIYTLAPGAPTNSSVNTYGVFKWTPTRAQANTTNPITIRFADANHPTLTNSVSFTVSVMDFVECSAGTNVLLTGSSGSVPVDFFSSARLTGLQAFFQLDTVHLTNLTVDALAPSTAGVTLMLMDSNLAAVTFTPVGAQTLQGTQHLARLRYSALPNRPSAFIPLHFTGLNAARATAGLPPTLLSTDGRIVVIGAQPMVEATGPRSMALYGTPGTTNAILQTTNVGDPGSWTLRGNVLMGTNLVRSVVVPGTPVIFYRLRQY